MKSENGSITLFVLISCMFLTIVVIGIYSRTSQKLRQQERDISKIQQSYSNVNSEDLYQEALERQN